MSFTNLQAVSSSQGFVVQAAVHPDVREPALDDADVAILARCPGLVDDQAGLTANVQGNAVDVLIKEAIRLIRYAK